ncbi:protein TOC75, chloroplastic isoform X2 [Gastrolobium bilobum]|uniref:protein TOC75, chloroplastic isoform X2 n=1 Tax=Gastrolobium bilobum TaxID=150636 RepID=UPI002AB0F0A0|nr:protein TOC75, chloroplastic isoform X2 [Gastrolobium bilobum]
MSSFAASNHLSAVLSTRQRRPLRREQPNRPSSIKCDLSSSQQPDSSQNPSLLKTLSTTIAVSSAAAILLHSTPLTPFLLSGGSNNGGGGSGGGGGGGWGWFGGNGGDGNGGFWSKLLTPASAIADESPSQEWDPHGLPANIVVQLNKLSGFKKYKVSEILFFDRRRRTKVGAEDSFSEMVSLRPGGIYTKAQLQKELETLATSGMFEKVDLEGKTSADGTIGVTISFSESTWEQAEKFRCINVGLMAQSKPIEMDPDMTDKERMEYYLSQERDYKRRMENARPCLLPNSVHMEIMQMLNKQGTVSARLLQRIRDRVQKWYHDEGYACAQVVNFGNLNTSEVVCEVVEGDITQLAIQFQDKLGNVVEGYTFNIEAGKQALRNINSLALFSNIEVNPRPDENNEGGIIVEIKLKELEQKTAEVSTEWSIVPGRGGHPTLASLQPGGTVTFEHRNLQGLNRSITGSVTTSNFLNPQDDLAFKLEYVHPYLDGVYYSRNRTLRVNCFNSRKLSPVFTGGPGVDEVPPIWVDRAGISADGPPTTLSGTGIDRMAFLQANITRDNTRFVNGAVVGDRNMFQVDQGLGDLPSYDAFTLGGPYSVRGYNMGEIGAARNILELAAELRVPIKGTHVYAFAEHGNDLGSSKSVKGNPTEVYRRMGQGSSYGLGLKLGLVRAEYAVDHNSGTGALFFRFGERF